jgi:catechol 2,3-dioxygenase-like lactoylglutathione lyase family enzyme
MLSELPSGALIPVSDLKTSLTFYEGILGLSGHAAPSGYELATGRETRIYLLTGTDYAGQAEWPLASFVTKDLDALVADLRDRGVKMESIETGVQKTNDQGIATMPGMRIAWIRDPDNQVISLFEVIE